MTKIAVMIGQVTVTRAAEGSSVITRVGETHFTAVTAEGIVDPTGCGDAYRAGLLYGLARDWGWVKSARLASLMGSIKVAHRGGQNHRPAREAIARKFGDAFGETF